MVTFSCTSPFSRVVMAGRVGDHMSLSLLKATSQASSSPLAATKSGRLAEPLSSSPSSMTVTSTGSSPVLSRQARSASMTDQNWLLLSAAPRA